MNAICIKRKEELTTATLCYPEFTYKQKANNEYGQVVANNLALFLLFKLHFLKIWN